MKGFERNNQLLSLCGLNCGLCSMYIGRYCPGCGGGDGNQGCKIARCGMERGNTDYCFRCAEYPCQKYEHIDENDSFITHRNQKADLTKAKNIGIDAYNNEQKEKMQILDYLLMNFNDGRKKTLFCQTVNLLELDALRELLSRLERCPDTTPKEKGVFAAEQIKEIAGKSGIDLTLRRKKGN